MNEKIKGLVISAIIIISSLSIVMMSEKIYVRANEGGVLNEENTLNSTFIYDVALNFSQTIFHFSKGRWFGSDGEKLAKRTIRKWMNESNLSTFVEQVSSGTSQEFRKSDRLMNFSEDLQVNVSQLTIYNSSNNTYMIINDFYIHPRWNASILEFLFPCCPYNKSKLTHVFEENNLEIKPRPLHISDLLNNFFVNHVSDILANDEIMAGNTSALTKYLLEQFEIDNNISFEGILANPENASQIPGFPEDTYSERGDYVFIGEDMAFNPVYNNTYWNRWKEIFDFLINNTNESCHPKIYDLLEKCRNEKQRIEMFIWSFCPSFKGLVIYDHNNDTYDMCYNSYYARPTIYINRSVGLDIIHDLDNHSLNYTIDQQWNASVESYNVIGQLNKPDTNNSNEYILIGCLYDGWHNQASADSAIGMGVLLAIARFFDDHHITPKTNIRFVAFSGEEAGGRGAFSYEKDHENDTIPLIIDLNQFGYSQALPRQALWIFSNNATENTTLHAIAEDTDFVTLINNATDLHTLNVSSEPFFSDHTPFYLDGKQHTIISFLKENTSFPLFTWRMHHRDGLNHEKGDTMTYYNPEEVNATASLIFNVTRYYTMNPNCWFDNISHTAFDSPNDGDTLNDSIRTNFTIHSILPSDKVRAELDLGCEINGEQVVILNAGNAEYLLTSRSQNESYVFTIPDSASDGNYSVSFKLYNSTGRINRIVYGSPGSYHNDTSSASNWSRLYHPLGYTKVGDFFQSVDDRICGSVFTANEDGRADNITAFINQAYMSPGPYTCMLYQANDNTLIGTTTSDWVPLPQSEPESSSWWAAFNFTAPNQY